MNHPLPAAALRAVFLVLLAASAAWTGSAAADVVYHVLQRGETLYSVARSYGVQADAIAKANSIEDPSKLRAGTRLLIPGATGDDTQAADPSAGEAPAGVQRHKVVKGETLFSIARSYGVSLEALRASNKLGPAAVIKVGELLLVPAGAKVPSDAVPAAVGPGQRPPSPGSTAGPAPQGGAASASQPPAPQPPVPVPEPLRTTVKAVDKDLKWPCPGEILYLEGKASGVLIRSKLGESEKALAAGTVSSAGPYRGWGNVVFVLSKSGYIYVYGGNESLSVRSGEEVKAGQELGKVGMDVKEGAPVAYFLVFKNGSAVDPAAAPRE